MSRRTALHESGHVIAGAVLGLPVPRTIIAWSSVAGHVATSWDELPLDDRGLREQAVASLAGEAVLTVFDDPSPAGGADYDRRMARGVLQLLAGEQWAIETPRTNALLGEARDEALALCGQHEAAIRRFADTLEANLGRLAGSEVRPALAAAMRGWPTPDLSPRGRSDFARRRRDHFEDLCAGQQFADTPVGRQLLAELWAEADVAAREGRPIPGPFEPGGRYYDASLPRDLDELNALLQSKFHARQARYIDSTSSRKATAVTRRVFLKGAA
jgi:hypothetical protein